MRTREAEHYLNEQIAARSVERTTSYSQISEKNQQKSFNLTKSTSIALTESRKKTVPHVLKTSDKLIHRKQGQK